MNKMPLKEQAEKIHSTIKGARNKGEKSHVSSSNYMTIVLLFKPTVVIGNSGQTSN